MVENKTDKKTYFVIILFMLIIILSLFVIINKALVKTKEINIIKEHENEYKSFLEGSKNVVELSLNNKKINELYNYINDEQIEYSLYKNRKKLNWNVKSLIISLNLQDKYYEDEGINYLPVEEFEKLYNKIFGNINDTFINNRLSDDCNSATFNKDLNRYEISNNCSTDNSLYFKSFLKNITIDDDIISINKYYAFVDKTNNKEDIYYRDSIEDKYLVINDIDYKKENKYINKMDTISYKFKKDKNSEYHLYKVEIGGIYE